MFCLLTENTNACDADVKGMGIGEEGEDQATSVYPPAIYCPDFIITKVFVFPSHASWNSFATFVLVGWSLVLKSLVAFVNCDSRDERNLQVGVALKARDQWELPPKAFASASAAALASAALASAALASAALASAALASAALASAALASAAAI